LCSNTIRHTLLITGAVQLLVPSGTSSVRVVSTARGWAERHPGRLQWQRRHWRWHYCTSPSFSTPVRHRWWRGSHKQWRRTALTSHVVHYLSILLCIYYHIILSALLSC